ncbi:hypothetical protein HYDPIDRAFT_30191, partial [Hydnomerulius pinastri MD-312]
SDSDKEFEALLTRPSRSARPSPQPPRSPTKQAAQTPKASPVEPRGRSKSRTRARSKSKSRARSKSKSRPARAPISTPPRSPAPSSAPATLPASPTLSPLRKPAPIFTNQKRTSPIPTFKRPLSPRLQLHTPPRSSSLADPPQDVYDSLTFTDSWESLRGLSPIPVPVNPPEQTGPTPSSSTFIGQPGPSTSSKKLAKTPSRQSLKEPKAKSKKPPQSVAIPKSPSPPLKSTMSQPRSKAKSKPPKTKDSSHANPPRKAVPEVLITQKKKLLGQEDSIVRTSDTEEEENELEDRIPAKDKGKGKDISHQPEGSPQETTFKPLGAPTRSRKRKRVVSSSTAQHGEPSSQEPSEPESSVRNHARSASRSSVKPPQRDGTSKSLDKDLATPGRFGSTVPGQSGLFSSVSTPLPYSGFPSPAYKPFGHGSVPPPSHEYGYNTTPPAHPASSHLHQRHPSIPPPLYPPSASHQGTPGPLLPGHPPPPIDPMQTQQAHYLLAQAMHQLSYLMSATMPSYGAYGASPTQPWQHQLPLSAYGTPVHASSHPHGGRAFHAPSSSLSHSVLPPSSPVRSSGSPPPPVEEHRAPSRARSKSRGRRVSFKLDNEECPPDQDDDVMASRDDGSNQRPSKREKESGKAKGKRREDLETASRSEDRGSPPRRAVARGRTPGPPSPDGSHATRGRSVSRR